MINEKKVLAVIPARSGSKGVARKNIKLLNGKPLIAWTIEEAKKSKYIDRLILSSEDEEIINVAKEWGCDVPFQRPFELAQDDTRGVDPVLHAIQQLPCHDYIVLLQPTSPLRKIEDIDGCIEKCITRNMNACVTVTEAEISPYWIYTIDSDNIMKPFIENEKQITRRQDLPRTYALNGAVYVAKTDWLLKTKTFLTEETIAYVMPKERSIDIDSEIDFEFASVLIEKRGTN